jgi:cytokinesis protein
MKAQASPNRADSDGPTSPASTGQMDVLLDKLRAAAMPAAKDQRDRRRRARLKDRHQVRVASGQKIPETGENVEENGLLSPTRTDGSEPPSEGATSEGEDIADRAASMLQGLRGDADGEAPSRDESLRTRRRRESADDERARRRARRRAGGQSTDTPAQNTITEETAAADEDADPENKRSSGESNDSEPIQLPTPTTIVVPPSPTVSEMRAREDDED